jgi:NAD(P)-dependent dehydrogenase (short-subunit alcohol dehydrogenase family)
MSDGPFSLQGKTVLLTGASAGLGRSFAVTLAGAGATVAAVARSAAALRELEEQVPGCVAFPADLAQTERIPELAAAVADRVGPVDILVNNAGVMGPSVRAQDESLENMRATLDVNLIAPMMLANSVFPSMRDRGHGCIVNVTSIVAQAGMRKFPHAAYAASKGGLQSLTLAWAVQWGRFGIRVNALAPGFFESSSTGDVIGLESVQQWIGQNVVFGRAGRSPDITGALLFLASDASSYMTGQTLVIDGGWTAH